MSGDVRIIGKVAHSVSSLMEKTEARIIQKDFAET